MKLKEENLMKKYKEISENVKDGWETFKHSSEE